MSRTGSISIDGGGTVGRGKGRELLGGQGKKTIRGREKKLVLSYLDQGGK